MKTFFLRFFTWWNGQTFGTQLWTWRFGESVGQDEFGNRYFRSRGGKIDPTLLMERRWVIYNGEAEASSIPPSWHGWIHHTVDVPPTAERYHPRPWQKPHRHTLPGATGDYKAWNPGRWAAGSHLSRPSPAASRVLTGLSLWQATPACGKERPVNT